MPADKVLIIDDQDAVRDAVVDIMEIIEVAVLTASTGRDGIVLFQERQAEIGVILLDMKMPGLSGAETLRELRRIDPHVYVIISTGYSESSQERQLADIRPDDFLYKPYQLQALIDTVRRGFEHGTAGREDG